MEATAAPNPELIDGKKACCREQSNLMLIEQCEQLEVFRCRVCQCRHFELSVDPGHVGVQFK